MIGWAAVTGSLSFEPFLLFLIIFMWTPPHFWALAICRTDDYARAGIPMMPVVSGDAVTRRQILIYTILLVPVGIAPWPFGYAGPLYGVVAVVTGAIMLLAGGAGAARAASGRSRQQAAVRLLDPVSVPVVRGAAGRARMGRADCPVGGVSIGLAMNEPVKKDDGIVLTEAQKRARRSRSIAIAVSLAALIVLFYVMTLVKGPIVLVRPL